MLESLTREQVVDLLAFYTLEPWGAAVEWMRTCTICSTIANVFGGKKQDGTAWSAEDFMPTQFKNAPKMDDRQLKAAMTAIAEAASKKTIKVRKDG